MATDLKKMNQAAPALQMMINVIWRCGASDNCVLQMRSLSKETGIPHPTLKSWLNHLAAAGLIEKKPAGPEGVRVRITDPALLANEAAGWQDTAAELAAIVESARVTTDALFAKMLAAVQPYRGAAS